MGDVKALNPVWQSGESKQLCQLFDCSYGADFLSPFNCSVLFKSVRCVGMGQIKKLLAHPLLWFKNVDFASNNVTQRSFQRLAVCDGVCDDFITNWGIVGVKLHEIGGQAFINALKHRVFCPDQFAPTDNHHIHRRPNSICFVGKDVKIKVFGEGGHLLAHKLVKDLQFLFVFLCHLKVFLLCKGKHLVGEHSFHLFVVALEEVNHLHNLFAIVLFCHFVRTRCYAPSKMSVKAGARGL